MLLGGETLTRDDGEFGGAVLIPGDALGLLHEERAEAAVLELAGVARRHRHHAAVHVQLAHHRHAALQLGPAKSVLHQSHRYLDARL